MRTTMLTFVACVGTIGAASATDFMTVRFHRADLETAAGRERVHAEIAAKVEHICARRAEARFYTVRRQRSCEADLAASALNQIGDARLSAIEAAARTRR